MDLTIRDATDDEWPAVCELTRRSYAEYASIMDPESWAGLSGAIDVALASAEPKERIVAYAGDALVGSVLLFPPSARAYADLGNSASSPELRLLAVAAEARGMGVGRALVDECIRRARRMGASELGLHTSQSMRVAMRMYTAMGFERVPERDFQPPGTELVEGYRLVLV